jgi:phosphoenolpyruvate---glycerone phosphotransferase subunit DhaL
MATMASGLDLSQTRHLLSAAARAVMASKDRLTKADQDIGDGDHGVGMARGFAAFDEATAKDASSIAELFRNCGRALMMTSGGASGVIFGTFFQGAGKALEGDTFFNAEAFVAALEGGLKAVQDRGKAQVGDKTMVDALAPAAEAARRALNDGASIEEAADAAAKAAASGADASRGLVAKVGKSKGLGDRTVGFIDPGALTTSILLDSICDTIRRRSEALPEDI